jgi:hypothetical protein
MIYDMSAQEAIAKEETKAKTVTVCKMGMVLSICQHLSIRCEDM